MPKIACPLHKRTYSLETGKSLSGEEQASVAVFPVKIEEGIVYLELPSTELLNSVLATRLYEITASDQSNTCQQCISQQDLLPEDQAVMASSKVGLPPATSIRIQPNPWAQEGIPGCYPVLGRPPIAISEPSDDT